MLTALTLLFTSYIIHYIVSMYLHLTNLLAFYANVNIYTKCKHLYYM